MVYIKRKAELLLHKLNDLYPILAVVGPRQAGKTTLLKEMLPPDSKYLLFDDPDIREIFNSDIKDFEKQYLTKNTTAVLDEVHTAQDPGSKLKYLADSGYKLWITASSEVLLGESVLSYLVGRVSIIRLYTFSFSEFLNAKNIEVLTPAIEQRETAEHIRYGGYPKTVTTPDPGLKEIILKDLYETMILKDIAKTFSILDFRALEMLSSYFAINTGTQLHIENLSQNIGISAPTIKKYIDAMEKSYMLSVITPFYTNKTKELTKQPKVYFTDTGMRNVIRKNYDLDGAGYENYILTELLKAGFTPKYWRTKTKLEIDFVIENKSEIIPIEVKLRENKITPALKSFINEYKPSRAYIVTFNGESHSISFEECMVKFISANELIQEIS